MRRFKIVSLLIFLAVLLLLFANFHHLHHHHYPDSENSVRLRKRGSDGDNNPNNPNNPNSNPNNHHHSNNNLLRCFEQSPKDIFLDVGSNQGDVLYSFYHKRQRAHSTNQWWSFPIHDYTPSKWHVYGFEASSTHTKALHELEQRWPLLDIKMGAVWNESDLVLRLNVDDSPLGRENAEWGSSLTYDWKDKDGQRTIQNVITIDFADFLRNTVCAQDRVVLKMNIEGAEFVVMQHLYDMKLLCLIDVVQMYWHPPFVPAGQQRASAFKTIKYVYHCFLSCGTKIMKWNVHGGAQSLAEYNFNNKQV